MTAAAQRLHPVSVHYKTPGRAILGERSEKVVKRPHIALLQEHNASKGFLEPEVF